MESQPFEARLQQALRLQSEKQYQSALDAFAALEIEAPDRADVLFQKAVCLGALARLEECEAICLKLRGRLPDGRAENLARWARRRLGGPTPKGPAHAGARSRGNRKNGGRGAFGARRRIAASAALALVLIVVAFAVFFRSGESVTVAGGDEAEASDSTSNGPEGKSLHDEIDREPPDDGPDFIG
jgi:hypothetical protein